MSDFKYHPTDSQCAGKIDLSKVPLFDAEHFTPDAKKLLK
jgi:hypothetical protein